MEKFKFVGLEPVDVPALRLLDVQPGDVVDVADKAVAEGLKGQSNWKPVKPPAKKES